MTQEMITKPLMTVGPDIADIDQRCDSLLILDVDEVVLEFISPFGKLLEEQGARLHPESFQLNGNIRSIATGEALSSEAVKDVTSQLYRMQEERQPLVEGVREALAELSEIADIVFLTAMTPTFYSQRRALLDREGLPYPMIATERQKGSIVAELATRWHGPTVFVDDLPPNLHHVRESSPEIILVHLMANDAFRPYLPALPIGAEAAADWIDAKMILSRLLSYKA